MEQQTRNTIKEALMLQVFSDVDQLLDKAEKVVNHQREMIEALDRSSTNFVNASSGFNQQTKNDLDNYVLKKQREVADSFNEEQRKSLQKAMNEIIKGYEVKKPSVFKYLYISVLINIFFGAFFLFRELS